MLAVIGVDGLHVLLVGFEPLQFGLQFFHGQLVIGTDPRRAGGAYLIQKALDMLILTRVLVPGRVLLFLSPHREIAAPGNQNRGYTGVNDIGSVEIFRQLAGVEVHQIVNLVVVHGIDLLFLFLCQLISRIHLTLVTGRCRAGLVGIETVEVIGPPGRLLVDGIILGHFSTS